MEKKGKNNMCKKGSVIVNRKIIISMLSLVLITSTVCKPVSAETFFHKLQRESLEITFKDVQVDENIFRWIDNLERLFELMEKY